MISGRKRRQQQCDWLHSPVVPRERLAPKKYFQDELPNRVPNNAVGREVNRVMRSRQNRRKTKRKQKCERIKQTNDRQQYYPIPISCYPSGSGCGKETGAKRNETKRNVT